MTSFKPTKLDPGLNIHGSTQQTDTLIIGDEANQLGAIISGQSGSNATITSVSSGQVTIAGLIGMSDSSITRIIYISGAANPNNNGAFPIISVVSATSVVYYNALASVVEANNGNLSWQERTNYSLQDDLNYVRTDRSNIKGTPYYSGVPTYQRPNNIGTNVPLNLANIADHTTDSVAYIMDRGYLGATVLDGYTQATMIAGGALKHADAINTLGVPVFDAGPFALDYASCIVTVKNAAITDGELAVLGGPHTGERVIGFTYAGASISPDSVEVRFYSVPTGSEVSVGTITPYTWELGQPTKVNFLYGYNQRLDLLDKNAFRTIPSLGAFVESADYEFILDNIPNDTNYTYTNTLTNGQVIQEKWTNTATSIVTKTIDYTYNAGIITSETRKIYGGAGVIIVAQMTINYVISNNTIISETITRDI